MEAIDPSKRWEETLANAACFLWVTKDGTGQENRSNSHVLFDVLTRSV